MAVIRLNLNVMWRISSNIVLSLDLDYRPVVEIYFQELSSRLYRGIILNPMLKPSIIVRLSSF